MVVDDDRHGGEDAHGRAPADRVDRLRIVDDARSQRARIGAGKRGLYFGDMGERQPDLVAAGNHRSVEVEKPEAGERRALGFDQNRFPAN